MLYDAITGSSSRLVITSLSPELPAAQEMTFGDYLQRMGEKFMPAAESIQMEAEYRDRKQGKLKDVQNYINAKYKFCSFWRSQMPKLETEWNSIGKRWRDS